MEKYLVSSNSNIPLLKRFANVSGLNKRLRDLANLAEEELWSIFQKNDLLYEYIFSVFDLSYKQNLIFVNSLGTHAVFNTGLLTLNGQDIYGVFKQNSTDTEHTWELDKFYKDSDRHLMSCFETLPNFVVYFEKPSDAYYDVSLELRKELDHIIDDNFDRLPKALQTVDENTLRHIFNGSIETTLKKVKRNNRIVAPQLYYGKITYLLPIDLLGEKYALAVEKINNQYRANTILTLNMAYMKARLVMKPESNWLIPTPKNEKKPA